MATYRDILASKDALVIAEDAARQDLGYVTIAADLQAKFAGQGYSQASINAAAQRIYDAKEAGINLALSGQAPSPTSLPTDAHIPRAYRYVVNYDVTSPSGVKQQRSVVIDSNTLLDLSELESAVDDTVDAYELGGTGGLADISGVTPAAIYRRAGR